MWGRRNLANVDVFVKVVILDVVVVVIQCNKNLKNYHVKVFTLKIQLKIWCWQNMTIYYLPVLFQEFAFNLLLIEAEL